MRFVLLALLAVNLSGSLVKAQQQRFVSDSLDRFIEKGMIDWRIPALSLAIVKDGKVIICKGYGRLKDGSLVDGNTEFMIASNTKLFTATGLALLENERKLSLDDRVQRYLPDFSLYDSSISKLLSIRDLVSHRMGFRNFQGDFLFWDTSLERKDVIQRLKKFIPVYPFRQTFGYSNSGYVIASEVIEKISGKSWERFMEDRLITPLGLNHTHMLGITMASRSNVAHPYTTCCTLPGEVNEMPFDNLTNLAPATGMSSTANDMARWLLCQLDSGRLEGKQIIPWSVLAKTREATTIVSDSRMSVFPLGFQFYGLGIGLLDYAGQTVFAHMGGAIGYRSTLTFVPEKRLGIIILTNQDNHNFHEALRFQLLDAYLDVPYTNRHLYYLQKFQTKQARIKQELIDWQRRVDRANQEAIKLSSYVGNYVNELYGSASITISNKNNGKACLELRLENHPGLTAVLEYMDGQTFRLTPSKISFGTFPVSFNVVNDKVTFFELKDVDVVDHETYRFTKNAGN